MSRILFINSVCFGSTGKICKDLYDMATSDGHECCIAYGRGAEPEGYNFIKIGSNLDIYTHVLKTRLFDQHGFGSRKATLDFIKEVKLFNPEIIHLHNIHGYYINIQILFNYLKQNSSIKVIWTLHDCWAFTGHCAHFSYSKCFQWQNQCSKCHSLSNYPNNIFYSNVKRNYNSKKVLFNGLSNITLVSPSLWLRDLIKKSFLKDYECEVINNGIDISVFTKLDKKDEIKDNKITILGVASVWDEKKGLNSFMELASRLINKPYKIVMVGLTQKQISVLPDNIVGIERTNNIAELVSLYNQADVFFNPTLEDNYPTVNLEAQACGIPVVAYDNGGTRETLIANNCKLVEGIDEFINFLETCNIDDLRVTQKVDISKFNKYYIMKKYLNLYEDK